MNQTSSVQNDDDDDAPLDADELLEEIVRALVRNPAQVRVTKADKGSHTELQVHTEPSDRRFVIGRKGATAMALRSLFQIVGGRLGCAFEIEIVEPDAERLARRGPKPV